METLTHLAALSLLETTALRSARDHGAITWLIHGLKEFQVFTQILELTLGRGMTGENPLDVGLLALFLGDGQFFIAETRSSFSYIPKPITVRSEVLTSGIPGGSFGISAPLTFMLSPGET